MLGRTRLPDGAGSLRGTGAWREPPVFFVLSLAIAGLFAAATLASRWHHSMEKELTETWLQRAESAIAEGRPTEAIEHYRNALLYSRDNPRIRLRLAEALVADGQVEEARSYLLALWEREPGNAVVSRELARLAARRGDVDETLRYYHGAIFGVWPRDPEANRRDVRFDLVRFLIARAAIAEAQSELIVLAAELPKDPDLHARVGELFMRASEPTRALAVFREALALNPTHAGALLGAGRAAFGLNDYPTAQRYLRQAARAKVVEPAVTSLLEMTENVLAIDPFIRRLPSVERSRRAARAFSLAFARLGRCEDQQDPGSTSPSVAAELRSLRDRATRLKPRARESLLRRDSDLIEATMEIVFEIERSTAARCGPPGGLDAALLLLAGVRAQP